MKWLNDNVSSVWPSECISSTHLQELGTLNKTSCCRSLPSCFDAYQGCRSGHQIRVSFRADVDDRYHENHLIFFYMVAYVFKFD